MDDNAITQALYDALFTFNAVVDGARDEGFGVTFEPAVDGLLNLTITEPNGTIVKIAVTRKEGC